jgi:hypothetical protein
VEGEAKSADIRMKNGRRKSKNFELTKNSRLNEVNISTILALKRRPKIVQNRQKAKTEVSLNEPNPTPRHRIASMDNKQRKFFDLLSERKNQSSRIGEKNGSREPETPKSLSQIRITTFDFDSNSESSKPPSIQMEHCLREEKCFRKAAFKEIYPNIIRKNFFAILFD